MLETLLVSALAPAAIDFVKNIGSALGRRFFGMSVDDQIKLENATVEKLKALAELDNPHGTPNQWVIDLRASFRYVSAALVIVVGTAIIFLGGSDEIRQVGVELVGMPFAFIFGERMLLSIKGGRR